MEAYEQLPPLSDNLIAALEKVFPERSPMPSETMEQLMVRAGNAEVVRWLRQAKAWQDQDGVGGMEGNILNV